MSVTPQTHRLLHVSRRAMATDFEVLLPEYAGREAAETALDVLRLIQDLERSLSVYIADSDVSRLNELGGQSPVRVDIHVINVIEQAIAVSRRTAGAFDITSGPLVESWGFTQRSGRKPSEEELKASLDLVGYQGIHVDRAQRTVRFKNSGMQINLGAIGKGYALDYAAAKLIVAGIDDFLIHGGNSSIVARGRRRDGERGWPVALSHPIHPRRKLGRFWLENESLSTSGSGKQFFHYRGQRMGHVIDPRTGWPGGDMLSLTVVAPRAAESDALATGLFVDGKDDAVAAAEASDDLAVACVSATSRDSEVELIVAGTSDAKWERFS